MRLADLGTKPGVSGCFFALPTVTYVLHMPLVLVYTRYVSKRKVMIFGFALMAISMFLVGNSPWLMIPDSLTITAIGLVLFGIAFSSVTVPVFPEMLEGVEKNHPEYSQSNELNAAAAGMFNASLGLGRCSGPLLAAMLNTTIGF